jgi:TRAP-type C4-dicarboxylate transport system permease small subunit
MNKWAEILIGIIILNGVILLAWYSGDLFGNFWNFKHAAWEFFKGGLVWILLMVGLVFIVLGISDLKE